MSSGIIQSVAYDNYDDFQHVNLIFSQISIYYFEDYLMTKLTYDKLVRKIDLSPKLWSP
jgi:hypothetical protein